MKHNWTVTGQKIKLSDEVCKHLEIDAQLYARLLDKREIRVNTIKATSNVALQAGDVVSVFLPLKLTDKPLMQLDVVYSDDNLLVLDKPQGIDVMNFEKLVQAQYEGTQLVHRLDRNTRGILVFGANSASADILLRAFKTRTVKKVYVARVHGKWQVDRTYKAWLHKDSKLSLCRVYDTQRPGSKEIETHFRTIRVDDNTTWLQVKPHTGRTHQIRAHLCHLNHPIIAEGKYSLPQFKQANQLYIKSGIKYQQLFATELYFESLPQPLQYLNKKVFSIAIDK
ncbi:MAG: RluA family pseudouridine synthase [Clostridiales bacterium]|jgi:23S rRNA pseudouridine955/2504/2580 synthase|nr:RluA family pseudouridine synthase [Clostridiales bacterium]